MDKTDGLERERQNLRNTVKRLKRAGDTEGIIEAKLRISEISTELRQIKKDLGLCDSVEERSKRMEEELNSLEQTWENTEGKEEKEDELFRRRGRTGRENDLGRQ